MKSAMVYAVWVFAFIFLLTGILLLFSRYWIISLRKILSLPPVPPSQIFSLGIWRLRLSGIFHIIVSLFLFTTLIFSEKWFLNPVIPVVVLLSPLLACFIIDNVMLFSYIKKNRSNIKKQW